MQKEKKCRFLAKIHEEIAEGLHKGFFWNYYKLSPHDSVQACSVKLLEKDDLPEMDWDNFRRYFFSCAKNWMFTARKNSKRRNEILDQQKNIVQERAERQSLLPMVDWDVQADQVLDFILNCGAPEKYVRRLLLVLYGKYRSEEHLAELMGCSVSSLAQIKSQLKRRILTRKSGDSRGSWTSDDLLVRTAAAYCRQEADQMSSFLKTFFVLFHEIIQEEMLLEVLEGSFLPLDEMRLNLKKKLQRLQVDGKIRYE